MRTALGFAFFGYLILFGVVIAAIEVAKDQEVERGQQDAAPAADEMAMGEGPTLTASGSNDVLAAGIASEKLNLCDLFTHGASMWSDLSTVGPIFMAEDSLNSSAYTDAGLLDVGSDELEEEAVPEGNLP
jgi:hypothetical protein